MPVVTLADGRRVIGKYDFQHDWWVVRLVGSDRVGEGHWVHAAVRKLFDVRERPSPRWVIEAANRLPERETPAGVRVMCRCCGFLTLHRITATTRSAQCAIGRITRQRSSNPGQSQTGGPGPNHLSLTEGRRNFAPQEGISNPRLKGRVAPCRAPLPEERP